MTNQVLARATRIACSMLIAVWIFPTSASAQNRRNGGGGITVYSNPNFSGESFSLYQDTPDLRGYSLNDKISSLGIPNGESWEVCQDVNYGNRCQVFSSSVSDLRNMGWNDRISSLRRVDGRFGGRRSNGGVYSPNGAQGLVLYDRPNFRGNSMVVNGDGNAGLNNRLVGSVQVRGGSWELCDRSGRCAMVDRDVSNLSQLGLNGRITSARLINGYQDDYGWNNGRGRGRGYGRRRR